MRRRRNRNSESGYNWLVTYSDMVTLILVFFVFLFSISQVDQEKFEAISQSFQARGFLDFLPSIVPGEEQYPSKVPGSGGKGSGGDSEDLFPSLPVEEEEDENEEELEALREEMKALEALKEEVDRFLEENELRDFITATRTSKGVELVLQDNIFFDPGQAVILDEGLPFLEMVGSLLSRIDNEVRIEGHTDSRPMNSYRYPSNWELSGARASVIVRFFVEEMELEETRFQIAGYGETRPIVPNDSEENMAKNRRVEIVILKNESEEDE